MNQEKFKEPEQIKHNLDFPNIRLLISIQINIDYFIVSMTF